MTRIMILFCTACSILLAAVPNILWLLGFCAAKICGHTLRYAPWGLTALGLAVLFWLSMAYGFHIGRWNLKVREVAYCSKDVPASFDGMRIVHISDLHLSTFNDRPEALERIVDAVNSLDADLICFTGDLVTEGVKEAEPYTETLRSMRSRYGVMSILGNHDFMIYRRFSEEQREAEVLKLAGYERDSLGWNLLRNESATITGEDGSRLTVIGVDNKSCIGQGFRTIDCGDLQKAMEGTEGMRILLSHDPSHWDFEVVGTGIQLTLSGHTHAAQFMVFGWSPASWMFKRVYGRYDVQGQTLMVNPGLGCTVPFRIGAAPEITVITLEKSAGCRL